VKSDVNTEDVNWQKIKNYTRKTVSGKNKPERQNWALNSVSIYCIPKVIISQFLLHFIQRIRYTEFSIRFNGHPPAEPGLASVHWISMVY